MRRVLASSIAAQFVKFVKGIFSAKSGQSNQQQSSSGSTILGTAIGSFFGGFFKDGGSFIVQGAGGPDSQLVQFMATPGERVTVMTPQQQKDEKKKLMGFRTGGSFDVANRGVTNVSRSFTRNVGNTSQTFDREGIGSGGLNLSIGEINAPGRDGRRGRQA